MTLTVSITCGSSSLAGYRALKVYPEGVIVLAQSEADTGSAEKENRARVTHERRDGEIDADSFLSRDRQQDGTMTCGVPCGLDLSALPVGMQLPLRRHRPNGRFPAVAEVPH